MPKKYKKGSKWIEKVVINLCKKYPNKVEYIRIHNLPWIKCLELIASSDILIDQIIIGWYGGISVEVALLWVVPSAYINPEMFIHIPKRVHTKLTVISLNS